MSEFPEVVLTKAGRKHPRVSPIAPAKRGEESGASPGFVSSFTLQKVGPMLTPEDNLLDYVDDYVHGLLSPDEARLVARFCENSKLGQAALEDARRRYEALQQLPPAEASEGLIRSTLGAIDTKVTRRERRQGRYLGSVLLRNRRLGNAVYQLAECLLLPIAGFALRSAVVGPGPTAERQPGFAAGGDGGPCQRGAGRGSAGASGPVQLEFGGGVAVGQCHDRRGRHRWSPFPTALLGRRTHRAAGSGHTPDLRVEDERLEQIVSSSAATGD